jgi:hypothetical protein
MPTVSTFMSTLRVIREINFLCDFATILRALLPELRVELATQSSHGPPGGPPYGRCFHNRDGRPPAPEQLKL